MYYHHHVIAGAITSLWLLSPLLPSLWSLPWRNCRRHVVTVIVVEVVVAVAVVIVVRSPVDIASMVVGI
ncbi:hypothetical protein H4582DRAFT_2008511, partial [Lactarius indigo]